MRSRLPVYPVFPSVDELVALRALLDREQEEAAKVLAALLARPAAQWEGGIGSLGGHSTPALVELLVERSDKEGPLVALEMARLAVAVADDLEPRRYGPLVCDARAWAWAQLAEARRRNGDLDRAEEALDFAEELASEGSADPLLEGHLLERRAALLTDWGDLDAAAILLLGAAEIYDNVADGARAARAREAASLLDVPDPPAAAMAAMA